MTSHYAQYSAERFGYKTIETDEGFITYHLVPPECSIEEFYVIPEKRRTPAAKRLADKVFEIAKEAGAEIMWARVTPGVNGADHAMRTNLHYGFTMSHVRGNDIILCKKIGG